MAARTSSKSTKSAQCNAKQAEAATVKGSGNGCAKGVCCIDWKPRRPVAAA